MPILAEIELRADGRELVGVVVQEGRAGSTRAELFAPGSIEWPTDGIAIRAVHLGDTEVKAIPTRDDRGRIHIRAQATDALRQAYSEGKRHLSVEFHSLSEGRTARGIREIHKALVIGAALVANPEYSMANAEIRQAFRLNSSIPSDRELQCDCVSGDCDLVLFLDVGLDDILEAINTADRNKPITAAWNNFGSILGSAARGSVRAEKRGADLDIEIDLPDSEAARALLSADEAAGVIVRPFIDELASETERVGDALVFVHPVLRALIVTATDRRSGWPDAVIERGEVREAQTHLQRRKRRYWL